MATRKGRTGRKTKRIRRMQTRPKSRRYKMRGGVSVNDLSDDAQHELGGRIAAHWATLGNVGVTVKSIKKDIDDMLSAENITGYEH